MEKELLTSRKYKLIQEIINLEDEACISKLEEQIAALHQKDKFWEAVKPIRKSVSLDQMITEQGYKLCPLCLMLAYIFGEKICTFCLFQ